MIVTEPHVSPADSAGVVLNLLLSHLAHSVVGWIPDNLRVQAPDAQTTCQSYRPPLANIHRNELRTASGIGTQMFFI